MSKVAMRLSALLCVVDCLFEALAGLLCPEQMEIYEVKELPTTSTASKVAPRFAAPPL